MSFSTLKAGFQPDAEKLQATDNHSSSSKPATAEMTQSSSKSSIKSRASKTSVKSKTGSHASLKKAPEVSNYGCSLEFK